MLLDTHMLVYHHGNTYLFPRMVILMTLLHHKRERERYCKHFFFVENVVRLVAFYFFVKNVVRLVVLVINACSIHCSTACLLYLGLVSDFRLI